MQEQLEMFDSILGQSNMFQDILNNIFWGLMWLFKFLCDTCETLLDEVYKLLDFTNYAGLNQFFTNDELRIFLALIAAGALIYFGITLIFGELKNKIVHNIILFLLVVTSLPTFMLQMNDIVLAGRDFINSDNSSISNQIISASVVDLVSIDAQGYDNFTAQNGVVTPINGATVNFFTGTRTKNIEYINPNEQLNKDVDLNSDLFFHRLVLQEDGTVVVEEIKETWWFIFAFTDWHYRYYINYLAIYIGLIAASLALFFTAFKSARIIFDLAFHQLFGTIVSAADLTSGQKTKAILRSVVSMYVTLILTAVLLKLFILGLAYITQTISNPLASSLILVAFAWAVIDGPNIIEKILGVDAGLSSGFKTLASVYMGAKAAGSAGKVAAKGLGKSIFAASKVASGAAVGTAGAVGSVVGAQTAKNNLNNNVSSTGTNSATTNSSSSPTTSNSNSNSQSSSNPQSNSKSSTSSSINTNSAKGFVNTSSSGSNINNTSQSTTSPTYSSSSGTGAEKDMNSHSTSNSTIDEKNTNMPNNIDTNSPIENKSNLDSKDINSPTNSNDVSSPVNHKDINSPMASSSLNSNADINSKISDTSSSPLSPINRDSKGDVSKSSPPPTSQKSNIFTRVSNSYSSGVTKGYERTKEKLQKKKGKDKK